MTEAMPQGASRLRPSSTPGQRASPPSTARESRPWRSRYAATATARPMRSSSTAVARALEGAHGVPFEVIVIAVIVVANAVLGFVQERKAEQAVAALYTMAATTATLLRDGRQVRIPAAEIVPGDVLVLG